MLDNKNIDQIKHLFLPIMNEINNIIEIKFDLKTK